MDFKNFIPDFKSVSKTDWAKPNIDTKNNMWLLTAGAAVLMLIFTFLKWDSVTYYGASDSAMGVQTWSGFVGLLCALCALYGALYNKIQFVFCAAVVGVVVALIGWLSWPVYEVTEIDQFDNEKVKTLTAQDFKEAIKEGKCTISHIGAILYLVASLAAAAVSFWQIKKANE